MTVPTFVRALPTSGTTGADASTITQAFDCTGCDYLVVGWSYQSAGGGSLSGASVSVATYNGVAMDVLQAFTLKNGSVTSGAALYGMAAPPTGSNNIVITMTGGTPATPRITLDPSGWSGVVSVGNVQLTNDGPTNGNKTANVTAGTDSMAVGVGFHGDAITGAGASSTLRGLVNNRATDTSGGCGAIVSRPGVGGVTGVNFTSSVVDHWEIPVVELVGTITPATSPPTPPMPRGRADWQWIQRFGVDEAVAVGSPQSVDAQIADLVLTPVAGTVTAGNATVTAQVATLTLTPLAGTTTGGATSLTAQVATLTLTPVAGTATGGAVTITAQVATLTLTPIAGVVTSGGLTVTAQVATITFTPVAGTVTGGAVTVTAQVGILTLTAIPGTTAAGQSVTAQIATLTLTPRAGTVTGGATTLNAQVATLNLTPNAGTLVPGGLTKTAQVATLALTAVPGSATSGGTTITAQVALLNLVALAGIVTGGPATVAAQQALLTLLAVPGVVISGTVVVVAGPVLYGQDPSVIVGRDVANANAPDPGVILGRDPAPIYGQDPRVL